MNVIAIENVIAIIFALTVQTTMSTRITASERANEFNELYEKQSEAVNNNIADFFKNDAWNYVKKYLLSGETMKLFLEEVNQTGYPNKYFQNRKLQNSLNFRILRYFTDLESSSLTLSNAHEIVKGFKIMFNNQFDISVDELYQNYMERNLNEVVSFENYYTLMAFIKDKSLIFSNSPAKWKIMNAIYSLTIRQYKPVLRTFPNDNPVFNCYFTQIMLQSTVAKIKSGASIYSSIFQFCNNKLENIVENRNVIELSSTIVYFNLTFWEYHQVVNIREVMRNDEDYHIILPDSNIIFSGPPTTVLYNGIRITTVSAFMEEHNEEDRLVKMANLIENLKTKEAHYLKNLNEF